ncbi:MAG TPA: hypothetical protein VL382_07050 [Terriglobales bacterium]|nr:hypothetical protein [Terriglobales bacterium]
MPSTHKKVIVRKLDRDAIPGYVAPEFVVEGRLELLNVSGKVVMLDLADIKGIYFVREFSETETFARKTFATRPRTEGLWVRLKFKDNETMEALMPNELTQTQPEGFSVIPPDTRANTQRIFVPRTALESLTVLAVIGGAGGRRKKAAAVPAGQEELFQE